MLLTSSYVSLHNDQETSKCAYYIPQLCCKTTLPLASEHEWTYKPELCCKTTLPLASEHEWTLDYHSPRTCAED